ncbi:MAG: MerR family transcriptional regulator, copper efflux regulator [Mycobacterium sp.]|nr:MerR family transcriptional regulator, copper efflux regulator [Mycobacterium sp.]
MTRTGQRIGDAAATLGVATHVLRHWEDVGLLRPGRLSSGHRAYDEQTIGQARMIQICQRAGLSLADIGALGASDRAQRIALIEVKRAELAEHLARVRRADEFLAHIVTCTHHVISECPECSELVGDQALRPRSTR